MIKGRVRARVRGRGKIRVKLRVRVRLIGLRLGLGLVRGDPDLQRRIACLPQGRPCDHTGP